MQDHVKCTQDLQISEGSVLNELVKVKGLVKVFENGNLVQEVQNLMVNSGRIQLAKMLGGTVTDNVTEIHLGTGQNSAQASDSNLQSETSHSGLPITVSASYLNNDWTVKFTGELAVDEGQPLGSSETYYEAGLFFSDGTMFARCTFDAIVKDATKKLTFEWSVLF